MIEPIVTDRLVLQPIGTATAAAIVAGDLGSLRAAAGWPQPDTIDGLRMEIAGASTPACWLVVLAGTVIGELGWKGGPGPDGATEIGYSLAPDYRGHGYGSELVAGFVHWATGRSDVRRVLAETLADNIASQRVLEKAGFTVTSRHNRYFYWVRETAS